MPPPCLSVRSFLSALNPFMVKNESGIFSLRNVSQIPRMSMDCGLGIGKYIGILVTCDLKST